MIVFSILEDTMKRPKTSKIVVYPIVEDTIHGLLWVHNRFLCAPSCPIAYTLMSRSANMVRINEYYAKRISTDWNENIGNVKALYPDLETYKIALKTCLLYTSDAADE